MLRWASICILLISVKTAIGQDCSASLESVPPSNDGAVNTTGAPAVILYCSGGGLDYIWQRNSSTESSQTNNRWILNVPGDDSIGAEYRCGYTSSTCGTVFSNNITLSTPPAITFISNNVIANETDNFTLTCEAEIGYPAPSISWWRGPVMIATGSTVSVVASEGSKEGVWSCVATNPAGADTQAVNVEINYTPVATSSVLAPSSVVQTPSIVPVSSFLPYETPSSPHLDSVAIVSLVSIVFFGVLLLVAILVLISVLTHCVLVTYRNRKTRRSVDKSRLIEEPVAPGKEELSLDATLPPSPSYINEGFNADDDDSSESPGSAHKSSTADAQQEQPKGSVPNSAPVPVSVAVEVNQSNPVEVTPDQDTATPNEDSATSKASTKKSHPLTSGQVQAVVEKIDLLTLQQNSSQNPLRGQFEGVPGNHANRDDWPAEVMSKNRYMNVIPNPHSAVKLSYNGSEHSTYINANFIPGYGSNDKAYIATQAPTYDTIPDFWRMVWEHDVTTIVMTCGIIEGGRNMCSKYWPPSVENDTQTYGSMVVRNNFEETMPSYNITYLTIYPSNTADDPSAEKDVYHFWYTAWPETGLPGETTSILKFHEAVVASRSSQSGPLVVHCSAGVGRTGTYVLIDILIREYEEKGTIEPLKWLTTMRQARGGVVQTLDQYVFVHRVLASYMMLHPK